MGAGVNAGTGNDVVWDPIRLELKAMADIASVITWITDPSGASIHLNRHWYDFTGQKAGAGAGDGWAEVVHDADRDAVITSFQQASKSHSPYHWDFRLRRSSGGYAWVKAVGFPYFAADGSFAGLVGTDVAPEIVQVPSGVILSARERQVLQWVAAGKSSLDVAELLGISARTVEAHVSASAIKLGTANRVQTVAEALRRGEFA